MFLKKNKRTTNSEIWRRKRKFGKVTAKNVIYVTNHYYLQHTFTAYRFSLPVDPCGWKSVHEPQRAFRRPTIKKAQKPVTYLKSWFKIGMDSRPRKAILPLYSSLLGCHLHYCTQVCGGQNKKSLLEWVQRRAMKRPEHLSYEDRLRQLGLLRLEKRRFWGHITVVFQYLNGA